MPTKSDVSSGMEFFPLYHIQVPGRYLRGCFSLSSLAAYLHYFLLSHTLAFWGFGCICQYYLKLCTLKYIFPNSCQRFSFLGTNFYHRWNIYPSTWDLFLSLGQEYGRSPGVKSHLEEMFFRIYPVMAYLRTSTEALNRSLALSLYCSLVCTLVVLALASKMQMFFLNKNFKIFTV